METKKEKTAEKRQEGKTKVLSSKEYALYEKAIKGADRINELQSRIIAVIEEAHNKKSTNSFYKFHHRGPSPQYQQNTDLLQTRKDEIEKHPSHQAGTTDPLDKWIALLPYFYNFHTLL